MSRLVLCGLGYMGVLDFSLGGERGGEPQGDADITADCGVLFDRPGKGAEASDSGHRIGGASNQAVAWPGGRQWPGRTWGREEEVLKEQVDYLLHVFIITDARVFEDVCVVPKFGDDRVSYRT